MTSLISWNSNYFTHISPAPSLKIMVTLQSTIHPVLLARVSLAYSSTLKTGLHPYLSSTILKDNGYITIHPVLLARVSLAYSSTLKTGVQYSWKTLVNFYRPTMHHISKDSLHGNC
jgi:Flp pilus assembly pilin Flp